MTQPPRRRIRFSLRLMLIVVTGFAIWLGGQVNWKDKRANAIKWMDDQAAFWDDLPVDQRVQLNDNPPLSLKLLGAPGLKRAIVVIAESKAVPAKQAELESLFPEADVMVVCPGTGYKGKHAHLVKH